MSANLDEDVERFVRKYGLEGVGHVSDVTDTNGRTVVLVDRPHGFMGALRVLTGRYHPHVEMYFEPAVPKE